MLVVFPVCRKDIELCIKQAHLIAKLGRNENHNALVVASNDLPEEAEQLKALLEPSFATVGVQVLPYSEPTGDWPKGANFMFQRTVEFLRESRNKLPWFFFEPDCVPLVPGWLDALETAYATAHMPFMGVKVATKLYHPETGEFVKSDGQHMIGAAIYPANFYDRSILWRYLEAQNQEWDIYLRWEISPHCRHTELLVHNYRTGNYKREKDGSLTCAGLDPKSTINPIAAEAVVVHGCKDGSLHDLILNEVEDKIKKEEAAPREVPSSTAATPAKKEATEPAPEPEPEPDITPDGEFVVKPGKAAAKKEALAAK